MGRRLLDLDSKPLSEEFWAKIKPVTHTLADGHRISNAVSGILRKVAGLAAVAIVAEGGREIA